MALPTSAARIRKALKGEPTAKVSTMKHGGIRIEWRDGLSKATVERLASAAAPEAHFQMERTDSRRLAQHAVDVVNAYFETSATLDVDGNIVTGNVTIEAINLSLYRAILTAIDHLDGDLFELDPENKSTPMWLQFAVSISRERAIEEAMQGVDLFVREEPSSRVIHPEVAEEEAYHEAADRAYAAHHWAHTVENAEVFAWGEYIFRETGHSISPDNFEAWLREIGADNAAAYAPTVDSPSQVRNYVCARMAALNEGFAVREATASLRAYGVNGVEKMTRGELFEYKERVERETDSLICSFEVPAIRMERCTVMPVSVPVQSDPIREYIRKVNLDKMSTPGLATCLCELVEMVQAEDATRG